MARYPLILKDHTFLILLQEASRQGKTFGRFANDILNQKAEDIESGINKVHGTKSCEICQKPAKYELFRKDGSNAFRCRFHKPNLKNCQGFKEIEAL